MRYIKAEEILPRGLLEEIQRYVDGAYIYIPRRAENKRPWGSGTEYRAELAERNRRIRQARAQGMGAGELAQRFCLSEKSIYRILRETD